MRYDVIYEVYKVSNPPADCGAQLTASVASTGDPNVFLIENHNGIPHFLGVCGVPDMLSISAGEVATEGAIYRTNTVTTTLRNETVVDRVKTMLSTDLATLSSALTVFGQLSLSEIADVGYSLLRSPATLYPDSNPDGFRMTVRCLSDEYDTNIFLHRTNEPNANGSLIEQPIAVCNPIDMIEVPSDSAVDEFPWYYRTDVFDIVSYDLTLLLNCWELLQLDASMLAAALAGQISCLADSTSEGIG